MNKKRLDFYFKKFKEDLGVNLVIEGEYVYAINKYTGCKQLFVTSEERIRIPRQHMTKVKEYINRVWIEDKDPLLNALSNISFNAFSFIIIVL